MTPEVLVVRELCLPGGGSLVVGVQLAQGKAPILEVSVYREGRPARSMLVHRDGFAALDRALAARRNGETFSEDVTGGSAVLRIEARDGEIVFSRHCGDLQMGMARTCRADEAVALEEALTIARTGT